MNYTNECDFDFKNNKMLLSVEWNVTLILMTQN
jgi:hypothetical protein